MAEAFDTLAASEELQTSGFDERQSKAVVRIINGTITGSVATKSDIENLQVTTKSDIENLQVTTKSEIELLKNEIKDLENRLKLWMFKALGTVAAAIVVITKLLDYVLDKISL